MISELKFKNIQYVLKFTIKKKKKNLGHTLFSFDKDLPNMNGKVYENGNFWVGGQDGN